MLSNYDSSGGATRTFPRDEGVEEVYGNPTVFYCYPAIIPFIAFCCFFKEIKSY